MPDKVVLNQVVKQYLQRITLTYQKTMFVSIPRNSQVDYTGFNMLNINLMVTERFHGISPNIGIKTRAILNDRIRSGSSLPFVIDYFELLFSSEFQFDPIDFFIEKSKIQPIIIIWRYNITRRKLIFSAPNHSDFYTKEVTTQIPIIEGDTHEI
jgi:hypothetical protein